MEIILNKIAEIFSKQKQKNLFPKKIAVAVSGGCDSLALTLILDEFCKKNKIILYAVTIDHKMRKSSAKEAIGLGKILSDKKINHNILTSKKTKKIESNIESKLREMRYEMLYEFCQENKIEYLFLGHHIGDVAENFLIRLFRGSGLDGLSTMSEILQYQKIKLIRPLLDITKEELQNFLQKQQIQWFEDETNNDEKFLRNKIRNFLNSFEEKNLIQKRIKKTSDEISKMRDVFDEEMLEEAMKTLSFQDNKFYLNLEKFKKIKPEIALKILALTVIEVSGKIYKPRLEKLKKFYDWILFDESHKLRDFYGSKAKKSDKNNLVIFGSKDIEFRTILKKIK